MRELGELGMSIGTSLAFEAEGVSFALSQTDNLLINLKTLLRNVIGSYPSDDPDKYNKQFLSEALISDMNNISKFIIKNNQTKSINLVIYNPTYNSLESKFPKAELWKPTTVKQIALSKIFDDVISIMKNKLGKVLVQTDYLIPDFTGKAMIITHHPIDLATCRNYQRLSLLESHSGAIKPFTAWNTKLTNGKELWNIPLNTFTIQIFGDNSTNFKSSPMKIREVVKKIAEEAQWTTSTVKERIRLSINLHSPDPVTRAGLLLMI